uniref:Uncharacterized protein n=1 Tax=Panagrolaimus davidi TaxID=227884 RepID=A0A914QSB2_9BILA
MSSVSNRKLKAEKDSMIPLSKRARFLLTYFQHQNWSLPNSIIYYILKNPSNSKVYQKLIQCCKYFFFKNPIIVVDKFTIDGDEKWKATLKDDEKFIDFTKISTKLWIYDVFDKYCFSNTSANPLNLVSSVIPQIYRCDAECMFIDKQIISYNEFLFLTSNIKFITLSKTPIMNENGTIVPLEKLVKKLPKLISFVYYDSLTSSSITSNTLKELLEIPHFSKITQWRLYKIPEKFDIETFYTFFKKGKVANFYLDFAVSISQAYKNRLESIVDEILETRNEDDKTPYIDFNGLSLEKKLKLQRLHYC